MVAEVWAVEDVSAGSTAQAYAERVRPSALRLSKQCLRFEPGHGTSASCVPEGGKVHFPFPKGTQTLRRLGSADLVRRLHVQPFWGACSPSHHCISSPHPIRNSSESRAPPAHLILPRPAHDTKSVEPWDMGQDFLCLGRTSARPRLLRHDNLRCPHIFRYPADTRAAVSCERYGRSALKKSQIRPLRTHNMSCT